jgi:hypothetical protein
MTRRRSCALAEGLWGPSTDLSQSSPLQSLLPSRMSLLKTLLTAAALGATAYIRGLGKKVSDAGAVPAKSGTKPAKQTKVAAADIASAQEQLDRLQWVVPALTGALVAVSSYAGEQQRLSKVAKGLASR